MFKRIAIGLGVLLVVYCVWLYAAITAFQQFMNGWVE